jgi:lipopolysaccharide transport system ATP-binding protein
VSVESSPAVRADGLGKRYEISLRPWSGALYDRIGRLLRPSARRANGERSTLWALREVSFEVPHGHVLGVLGRNGSGKTTLMKILARVTAPTEGTALTYGRVGAMLQVGTGFHPELSGRDNIALSGAILGMSRAEVAARTEQIIDFAEIGRFLDTPVKHYSSGMYLRLAFSVSAHLAADVLLIDEVLAVGDAAFQKKCRERIRSSVAEGRTVLFVSHQMASVKELCDSAMVLDQGRMIFMGDTQQAVKTYDSEVGGRH